MTYSEKLKDPRWQKKRLEIMNRDKFKCSLCGDKETTLNVHHLKYNGNPWESLNEDLQTLCQDCHGLISFLHKSKSHWQGEFIKSIFKTKSIMGEAVFYCLSNCNEYFIFYYATYEKTYFDLNVVDSFHLKGLMNHFKLNKDV